MTTPAPEDRETTMTIEYAARFVYDTFKRDLDRGYKTADKVFAVEMLGEALRRASAPVSEDAVDLGKLLYETMDRFDPYDDCVWEKETAHVQYYYKMCAEAIVDAGRDGGGRCDGVAPVTDVGGVLAAGRLRG